MPPAKKEYLQQAGILNMKLGLFSLFFSHFPEKVVVAALWPTY